MSIHYISGAMQNDSRVLHYLLLTTILVALLLFLLYKLRKELWFGEIKSSFLSLHDSTGTSLNFITVLGGRPHLPIF